MIPRTIKTHGQINRRSSVFLQLHNLLKKKQRLEKEAQFWERKRKDIERQLSEADQQIASLQKGIHFETPPASDSNFPKRQSEALKKSKVMVLKY